MAGRKLGVAELRDDGGLSTRGACSKSLSKLANYSRHSLHNGNKRSLHSSSRDRFAYPRRATRSSECTFVASLYGKSVDTIGSHIPECEPT